MRRLSVVAVVAAVVMSVVGCGGGEVEQHELTRPSEEVSEAALSSGESRSFASDGVTSQVEGQVSAMAEQAVAETCSGACNATTCVCEGSYSCCSAGCRACWGALDSL